MSADAPQNAQETPQSDERLYGLPYAEYMETDLAAVWENVEGDYLDSNVDCPARTAGWSLTIEEWSVEPASSILPKGDDVAVNVVERWCEDTTEESYESYMDAAGEHDVIAAFQHAVDLLASKVTWRMAGKHLADHAVTFDGEQVLLDGEPMYRTVAK